ncbi:phosphate regulon sensor histidine kinase PhoR [Ramlibacter solisilvae]|uniref:Phosphate regulon sensor protein PhoR n=1 Tax=Ramlibacter tataouinensis TaxID=94132 RepID=A0A127JNR7_9BURK|nr:phosphate regulon sensor histidine kinase PhoR [Ramlibacter tataouinensis]AMO21638.1 histidine kinase [Ramlibacter tataouinensis]
MGIALLLFACAAASAAVAFVAGPAYAPAGALLVLLVKWLVDRAHLRRLMDALRDDAVSALPARSRSVWGEIAHRVARLLRDRDERLRESQARLQEFLVALENSPNGVVLLDENGRIEWCNQTAAGHFGFDAQRDQLQYVGNLVRDPAFAAYLASWNYAREVVLSMSRPGGAPLKLSVQAHPYAGSRRLILSRDVTAMEQAEAMRRDFVANVSHEIRTPLTVLAGFVETMQTLALEPGERARYLQLMSQQAQRMQTLVNDLLALSRLEGSPPPGVGEWLPLRTLVAPCEEEARSLSRVLAPQRPHELVFAPLPALEVSGSPGELQSAISNLLSNAVRYTPPGGSIDIKWQRRPDGRLELAVRDSGPGIAPEHLLRLTERFYRVDRSRSRETGGTGLGLAIVKHVVQRHGAELKIESTPGAGSTFSIMLPASRIRGDVSAGAGARPATESLPG